MDNEEIVQQDIQEDIPEIAEPENEVQDELLEQLRGEIVQLKIKLALLVGGAAFAKLDEGIKLAEGILTADGVTPEEAAAEVLEINPVRLPDAVWSTEGLNTVSSAGNIHVRSMRVSMSLIHLSHIKSAGQILKEQKKPV